jgi:hypothetical protein
MRTPPPAHYERESNGVRIEDAALAAAIDARLAHAWAAHPHVVRIDSRVEFLDKAAAVLQLLDREVPLCCRSSVVGGTDGGQSAA